MGILSPELFEQLLPLAATWAEQQETHILEIGLPLSAAELSDAQEVGVAHPERVRLLSVPAIPIPQHSVLRAVAEVTQLIGPFTAGLTLRYGIYVRSDFAGNRHLVAHELVHTAQYERLGGFLPFLRQYLHECLTIGYPDAPMEQEAVLISERLHHGAR